MQIRKRFYTNAHGADDNAVSIIIQKAIEIDVHVSNISRIVFVAHGLQNGGWLDRKYGPKVVNKLKKGTLLPNTKIVAKFESLKTYKSIDNEIVITLGIENDDILLLDDNYNINTIIALPWIKNSVDKWARITNAINIDDNIQANSFTNPPCIVIQALEHLTESINMSTGLCHYNDDNLAKTYLRALTKYGFQLQETEIESYLIKQLDWTKKYANELLSIIIKINTGHSFKGGDKTGLKNYITNWQKECNK